MTIGNGPGGIVNYINSQKGVQLTTRFSVSVVRPQTEEISFMCDLAYLPAKKIKIYNDYLSGSASPLPIPYGLMYSSNLMQFVVEETWASRKYFENWMSDIFGYAGGGRNEADVLNNKVRFYDDVSGTITIQAISYFGNGNEPIINATYIMTGCVPIELVTTKFDSATFNTPLKFPVNILYRTYNLIIPTT